MLRCRPLVLLALLLPGCLPFRAKTATSEQIKVARLGLEAWFGDEKWKPKGDGLTIIGPLVRLPARFEHKEVNVVVLPTATEATLSRLRARGTVVRLNNVRVVDKAATLSYEVWYPGEKNPNSVVQKFFREDNRWQRGLVFAIQ